MSGIRKWALPTGIVCLVLILSGVAEAQSRPSPWQSTTLPTTMPAGPKTEKPAPAPLTTQPKKVEKPATPILVGGFDWGKSTEERSKVLAMAEQFPNLGFDFEVTAPSTTHPNATGSAKGTYNCIAWSLGITSEWVWPGKKVKDFDKLYGQHGFKRLTTRDTHLEKGLEKVALYGKLNGDGEIEATHAARQEIDGTWTSKLGALARIRHRTADSIAGPTYGDPIAVYFRKK